MRQDDHKKRISYLYAEYSDWFQKENTAWGLYDLSYMPGWFSIIENLLSDNRQVLSPEKCKTFRIVQIKEKFGRLRVYYEHQDTPIDVMGSDGSVASYRVQNPDNRHRDVNGLIAEATAKSAVTCMNCGDAGELRSCDWIVLLCDHHWDLAKKGKSLVTDFELMSSPRRTH